MNDEQLDGLLKALKSSSQEPASIDPGLEARLIKETKKMKSGRRRMKYVVIAAAALIVGGTGFVASGGEAMVQNYLEPRAPGEEGVERPSYWSRMIHHIHAHFRQWHGHGPDQKDKELHSYDEPEGAK